jgi:hypothetical protein
LYTPADIDRLCMLRQALDLGHSIGHAAAFSDSALKEVLAGNGREAAALPTSPARTVSATRTPFDAVVGAIESYSYADANRELSRLAAFLPPREIVHDVALPLMRLAGERWDDRRMRAAQEHMLSDLLGSLMGGILRTAAPASPAATLLSATFSGDLHSFGILAASALASIAGLKVVHLGANLPVAEISYAAKRTAALVVIVSVTYPENSRERLRETAALRRRLPETSELWVAANPETLARSIEIEGVRAIRSFDEFEQEIRRVGGRF